MNEHLAGPKVLGLGSNRRPLALSAAAAGPDGLKPSELTLVNPRSKLLVLFQGQGERHVLQNSSTLYASYYSKVISHYVPSYLFIG